jgi:hypothetical protein
MGRFLDRAAEFEKRDLVVHFYCLMHSLDLIVKEPSYSNNPKILQFSLPLLERVETVRLL